MLITFSKKLVLQLEMLSGEKPPDVPLPVSRRVWASWQAVSSWRLKDTCCARIRPQAPWSAPKWRKCAPAFCDLPTKRTPHLKEGRRSFEIQRNESQPKRKSFSYQTLNQDHMQWCTESRPPSGYFSLYWAICPCPTPGLFIVLVYAIF